MMKPGGIVFNFLILSHSFLAHYFVYLKSFKYKKINK